MPAITLHKRARQCARSFTNEKDKTSGILRFLGYGFASARNDGRAMYMTSMSKAKYI